MDRRKLLAGLGGATTTLLAGCSLPGGGSSQEDEEDEDEEDDSPAETDTATGTEMETETESLQEEVTESESGAATGEPTNTVDRFVIDAVNANDVTGVYYLDDVTVGGRTVTGFESGMAGWTAPLLNEGQSFELEGSVTHSGSYAGKYTYGPQSANDADSSGSFVTYPFDPTRTGPFSFWLRCAEVPEDDIVFGWSTAGLGVDSSLFGFNVNRETTGSVFVRTANGFERIDTQYSMETDVWHRFVIRNVDWQAGTGEYAIETASETITSGSFEFQPPADQN